MCVDGCVRARLSLRVLIVYALLMSESVLIRNSHASYLLSCVTSTFARIHIHTHECFCRDVWKIYLDRKQFEQALQYCKVCLPVS